MGKKYELTDEILEVGGHVLHRIKALRDFGNVRKGDIGGWIECEDNLSHGGDCWVNGNAKVLGNAKVFDNACVCDNAKVYGAAVVCNNAAVLFNSKVFGNAIVRDNAKVFGSASVYDSALICDDTAVYGYAEVYGDAKVCDKAAVYTNAIVFGNARVCGNAIICSDAEVKNNSDYIVFKNWWSSGRYFTWTRSNDTWSVGCFYGTGEELIKKAYNGSDESGREYKRIVKYVESIKQEFK